MKRARVAWGGRHYRATPVAGVEGRLQLEDGPTLDAGEVEWLLPLEPTAVPRTVFALGLNYADHASELAFQAPAEPLVFLKGLNTLAPHGTDCVRPAGVAFMHYECELVVVLGRAARAVPVADALEVVAGYTIANDYAIRDYLENYYRPNLRVKSRDGLTPLGPWLTDASDVADPMNLALTTRVNGVTTQSGTTHDMIFDVATLISYLSGFMTLAAGDIILTGTPHGLKDVVAGDHVACEIEGLGVLESHIVAARDEHLASSTAESM